MATLPDRRVLFGAGRLFVDAATRLADVVEAMHHNVARLPFQPRLTAHGRAHGRTRGLTGLIYRGARAVVGLAGASIDALLDVGDGAGDGERIASLRHDAVVALLNGVVGDHLAATGNPLAIPMRLRVDGRPLTLERAALAAAFPAATDKVVVLLHGSCMGDRQWVRNGHEHGQALARDLGYTPLYLHYNSGLHIAENGAALVPLLRALHAAWPVPIAELALLCHSMGGLVARSALHLAPDLPVSRLVFLGTPHHGSPLERTGNIVTTVLGATAYTGPIGRMSKLRSAGVTDLRHGTIEAHPPAHDRFHHGPDRRRPTPLPRGVACYAIAASLGRGPLAKPLGDGLVPVASALGTHPDPALDLGIPVERRHVVHGIKHLDLLDHAEVYAHLVRYLG